jgi:hypothetical protein
VPAEKQVNLYQNGFLSVSTTAVEEHGAGITRSPQMGTDAMLKVSVPQTGKAVPGFCPSVPHNTCVKPVDKKVESNININIFL